MTCLHLLPRDRRTRRWRRTAAPPLRSTLSANSDAPFTLGLALPAAVAQLCVRRMSAYRRLFARHIVAIHIVTWGAVVTLILLDSSVFDWPHPFAVPLSVYIFSIGLPFVIVPAFKARAPDVSLESLRRFIRNSPWFLTMFWVFAVVMLVMAIIGDIRIKGILEDVPHTPNHPASGKAGITPPLTNEHTRSGLPEPER